MSEEPEDEPELIPEGNTTPHTQTVCYLRLSTGDELIAECLGEGEDKGQNYVVVKSPMLLSETTNPISHIVSVSLAKYIPLADFEVLPIFKNNIVFLTPVIAEMKEFYNYSVIYTKDIVTQCIVEDLKNSILALKKVIVKEHQEQFAHEELQSFKNRNLVIPSNTSLH
jgi:hypothetical protein